MVKRNNIYSVLVFAIGLSVLPLMADDLEKKLAENDAQAERLMQENNPKEAVFFYSNSGELLYKAGRLEEAAGYYEKALQLNESEGNRGQVIRLSTQLGLIYLATEKYSQAIPHLEATVRFYKSQNNQAGRIDPLINLARAQLETGQLDNALENCRSAFGFSHQTGDLEKQIESAKLMIQIFQNKGEMDEAERQKDIVSGLQRRLADEEIQKEKDEKAVIQHNLDKQTELTREQQLELEIMQVELDAARRIAEAEKEKNKALDEKNKALNDRNIALDEKNDAINQRNIYLTIGLAILLASVIALTFMFLQIRRANKKIDQQRQSLAKQNREIKASIRYAQTIQKAMLPGDGQIQEYFESFITYRPKDIVSGDFYWVHSRREKNTDIVYFAVVDCTGHGVPGAFMSMIGNRLLNEIVAEREVDSPAEILKMLNSMVREALRQEETDNNDGMDLALCKFEMSKNGKCRMTFAGAKRPIYIIDNQKNKLLSHIGDRKSIGGYSLSRRDVKFTDHQRELNKGDMLYLFSDGIIDQNGPDRKKFGRLRLEEALVECAKLSPLAQKELIEQRLDEYMQEEDQRDDIALVGLKVL